MMETPNEKVTKTLIFIRHGESEYNAHMKKYGEDPLIQDAPLTEKGRSQAIKAQDKVRELLRDLPAPRVVSSPLMRAIGTALLAMPAAAGNIEIWPELREIICGCDDLGTPASLLQKNEMVTRACGVGAACLEALPEIWWTVPQELVGSLSSNESIVEAYCKHQSRFEEADEDGIDERLEAIISRLQSVRQEVVVIVAHCDLIARLTERLGLHEGSSLGWGLRNAEARIAPDVELRAAGASFAKLSA